MIDSVRNTVLAYINKDNRGYLTPAQFNLFARQAQMDRFEQYIYDYNNAILKQNARQVGSDYAGIAERLAEVIESFSVSRPLAFNGSLSNFYYPGTNPSELTEIEHFKIERIVYNSSKKVDKVSQGKAFELLSSNLTAPSALFPVYVMGESGINIYPTTLTNTLFTIQYIRYPKPPKWTYDPLLMTGGEPIFDPSIADFQDFELPLSDEPYLISKICQYAGITIREEEVVNAAKADEIQDKQEKL